MADILSQDEIDALLTGLTGGMIEAGTGKPAAGNVAVFDFANQDRAVRGRMPALEMIHDKFARLFRTTIAGSLRRPTDLSIVGTEVMKFGEFLRGLAAPASLHLFKMEPLKGCGILAIEGKLVFALVETYFGGRGGSHFKLEGRDFTPIECRIIKKVVDLALADYRASWQSVHPVSVEFLRSEINPQFANVVPPGDMVTTVECELELEDASGRMIFCLPFATLEPIKDKLRAGFQSESAEVDAAWNRRLAQQLEGAPVDILVQLGTGSITGRELMGLQPGDIITLRDDFRQPLKISIADIPKLQGVAGSYKGNRAVQLIGRYARGR